MKIALFSDLHLEFREDRKMQILDHVVETCEGADLVINAGDTHHDPQVRRIVRHTFDGTQYVETLGNHDYYGNAWSLDMGCTQVGDARVVHGTMWTDFWNDPTAQYYAQRWITDFRFISGFDVNVAADAFVKTVAYVELMKPEVVVTHFAPSSKSILPKWNGSEVNPYFCPDAISKLNHKPKLWLHGHIHDPVDYEVDGVRVVANPLGYPGETYKNHKKYAAKIIEV